VHRSRSATTTRRSLAPLGRLLGARPPGGGLATSLASALALLVVGTGTYAAVAGAATAGLEQAGAQPAPVVHAATTASGAPASAASLAGIDSNCSPTTDAATSGGSPGTLTATATEVASGTVEDYSWALWSKNGETGATALEDGGLVLDGRSYGLCPGYPNPAELEMLDVSPDAMVYGVIGYPGKAKVALSVGVVGSFTPGKALPSPFVQVVDGCRSSSERCRNPRARTPPWSSTPPRPAPRPSTTWASPGPAPARATTSLTTPGTPAVA
jgi:hypothetical protein